MSTTIFPERERAIEAMFAQDEELRFRALARRNRLLALWVAERMGLRGSDRDFDLITMFDCCMTWAILVDAPST